MVSGQNSCKTAGKSAGKFKNNNSLILQKKPEFGKLV